MSRAAVLVLLAAACATAPPVRPTRVQAPPGMLRLQLRPGHGAPPCSDLGGGLEDCPVFAGPEGIHFLSLGDLGVEVGPPRNATTPVEHARFRGLLALAATLADSTIEWMGDETDPHLVARISCPGDESFDAARLLTLHTHTEELMDDLGLQYLAAVPDTRMLLVFREGEPRALSMARAEAARGGGGAILAPDVLFLVNPDGLQARPW